ncbi:MAG: hypothetical protein WCK02_14830 [Bacteroidota bacterium]
MKNINLVFFILFCFASVITLAQSSVVPSFLNDSLIAKYPEAEKITWSFEDSSSLFVANFKHFKKDVIAKYNKNGVWERSITEANQREIPYLIGDYIRDKYTKELTNTIDKISIYEFKNGETYYLALIKSQGVKERVKVYFSISGKFLKVIEPKEYLQKNTPKTKEGLENMILNDDF